MPDSRPAGVFERVVCGIDASPESLEALRQAERLRPRGGSLHLVTAAELSLAVHGGFAAPSIHDWMASEAEGALARAVEQSEATTSRLVEGTPADVLLHEIDRLAATVVVVGSHGSGRGLGILLGSAATTLLHAAPCSVLVARPPADPQRFPAAIVVGVDGSRNAERALEAARELGARLGVPVRVLAAAGGKPVDFDGLRDVTGLEWAEQKPVPALVDASCNADLVVVGSRGVHGLAALGSVSERVAHRAACSVHVVRGP